MYRSTPFPYQYQFNTGVFSLYGHSISLCPHYSDVMMGAMASPITGGRLDCLPNRLFRRKSKKTPKPRSTGLCEGNSPVTSEFPTQRHNGRDGVSNRRRLDCLPNRLFRRKSKKTSKLRATGRCDGNSPVTGEFPTQRASNAENVSIWWRHHVMESTIGRLSVPSLPSTLATDLCPGGWLPTKTSPQWQSIFRWCVLFPASFKWSIPLRQIHLFTVRWVLQSSLSPGDINPSQHCSHVDTPPPFKIWWKSTPLKSGCLHSKIWNNAFGLYIKNALVG